VHKLEPLATGRGRSLPFDVDQSKAGAEHLPELVGSARASIGLIGSRDSVIVIELWPSWRWT
jgi:hypothetical protein